MAGTHDSGASDGAVAGGNRGADGREDPRGVFQIDIGRRAADKIQNPVQMRTAQLVFGLPDQEQAIAIDILFGAFLRLPTN